jgi:hypothetical protein
MQRFDYKQSQANHTLFIKHSSQGNVTALIVYVDDIVLTRNDDGEIHNLKHRLANKCKIKDLGSLKYFLGIEVAKSMIYLSPNENTYLIFLRKHECSDVKPLTIQ